jgi:hypothetical protein
MEKPDWCSALSLIDRGLDRFIPDNFWNKMSLHVTILHQALHTFLPPLFNDKKQIKLFEDNYNEYHWLKDVMAIVKWVVCRVSEYTKD